MENSLFDYMNKRIAGESNVAAKAADEGPVITISRLTGCGASRIAWAVCEEINKRRITAGNKNNWHFISREILLQTAEQLNLDPQALEHIMSDKNRGMMDQIVAALSTHTFKSDQKILNTIQDVIRQFGNKGHVVIVGRGGALLCNSIKKSLHIRLQAPFEWRVSEIATRLDFSKAYAAEYVKKTDTEREHLISKLAGSKGVNQVFDVELNRARFTEAELVNTIADIAAIKGLY